MYKRFSIRPTLPLALIALVGSQAAMAGDYDEGQWVTTFLVGSHFSPRTNMQSQATGMIPDLGAIDATLTGAPATVSLDRLSFHDAFHVGPEFGIESGYMTDSNVEPFVRLEYSKLRGRTTHLGEINSPALASPASIDANFSDMDAWALNVGARYFMTDTGTVRPFLAGFVGADRIDAMHARLGVSGLGISSMSVSGLADLGQEVLLPQETRFDAGVEGGVNIQLADQADLRFSVGADYVASRHTHTDAFAPLGVDSVRMVDQRWSIPLDVGLSYHF